MNQNSMTQWTDEDRDIFNNSKNPDTLAAMLVFSTLEHHKINDWVSWEPVEDY